MQNIVNELINNSLKGVDTYRYKDSIWLIFTDENRWVVELTDEGTLWFNYRFFQSLLRYVSLGVTDGSKFITKWAESHFLRSNDGWKVFDSNAIHRDNMVYSVVKGGVKKTEERGKNHGDEFEWYTRGIIGKGVKKVDGLDSDSKFNVRNVMNYGVKKSMPNIIMDGDEKSLFVYDYRCTANNTDIWMIIEDGIKNTYPDELPGEYDWTNEFNANKVAWLGEKI